MIPTAEAVGEAAKTLQEALREAPAPFSRVLRALYVISLEETNTMKDALSREWLSFTVNATVAKAMSAAEDDGKTLDADRVKDTVLQLTRALGDRSFGRFFVGRRGKKSRYVLWPDRYQEDAAMVAAIWNWAASNGGDLAAQVPQAPPAVETLEHAFQLRPGLPVKIQLPANLSKTEAARLARFVESLPFDAA